MYHWIHHPNHPFLKSGIILDGGIQKFIMKCSKIKVSEETIHQLDKEGIISMDIRSREIGRHTKYYTKPAQYSSTYYYANNGHNYFIEYESYDRKAIFGFIRLRFTEPDKNMTRFDILKDRGLIRELHVYGNTTAVDTYDKGGCQHTGIGKGLLRHAEIATMEYGLYGIVVISGEGVKGYYEKQGYRAVSYTHLRAHETLRNLVCRLQL